MTDISELVEEYKKGKEWKERRTRSDNTQEAISLLIDELLENNERIEENQFRTIFQICQHDGVVNKNTKIENLNELNINEDIRDQIEDLIEDGIGLVGAGLISFSIPNDDGETYDFLEAIKKEENKDELNRAINTFTSHDVSGIQSGTISPILYFLHREKYPIINGNSIDKMEKYFNKDISQDLSDYTSEVEKFEEIRDNYEFDKDFSDLDKFLVWLSEDMNDKVTTWQITPSHEKRDEMWDVYSEEGICAIGFSGRNYLGMPDHQIKEWRKNNGKEGSPEKARSIFDFYNEVEKGDIIIAKTAFTNKDFDKPYGIGIVKKEVYHNKDKAKKLFPEKCDHYATFINVDWKIDFVNDFGDDDERPELELDTGFSRGTLHKYDHFDNLRDNAVDKYNNLKDTFFEIELLSKKLKLEPKIWFEKTERDNKSSQDGWGLGECLATPQRDSRGADIYTYMRKCRKGDVVIHYLQDEDKLVGISKVSKPYEEVENPPQDQDSRWEGRPGYRVLLENYKELGSPILRKEILENDDYEDILHRIKDRTEEKDIHIFYDVNLNLNEGAYLTKVPKTLMKIFTEQEGSSELEEYLRNQTNFPIENLKRINLEIIRRNLIKGPPEITSDTPLEIKINITEELDYKISPDTLNPLHFPENNSANRIVSQISAALNAGKHIILTGPPGTGKTEVARLVCEELSGDHNNLYSGYQIATATADWSTFDTVGGYMPGDTDSELKFNAGQILRRFKSEDNEQKNELLVLDEINRSDIDKAFGPIFTLLSGQPVQLPFKDENEEEIEIIPVDKYKGDTDDIPKNKYIVPKSWRIIATMNTYDKTSLYEMSYAFMRRFQFIRIDVPEIPEDEDNREDLMKEYVEKWDLDISSDQEKDLLKQISDIWRKANTAVEGREIGPAIVKDMLAFMVKRDSEEDQLVEAITGYIYPQLEGIPEKERKGIIEEIMKSDHIENEEQLKKVAQDMLQVNLNNE